MLQSKILFLPPNGVVAVVVVLSVSVDDVVESTFVVEAVLLLFVVVKVVVVFVNSVAETDNVDCSDDVVIDPVGVLAVHTVSNEPVSMEDSSAEDMVDPVATSRVFWATVRAASTSAAAWTSATSAEARAVASSDLQVTVLLTISLLMLAIRGLKV